MNELWLALIGLISTGGAGYFGWFFGRRKTNAEAETVEISNRIVVADHHKKLLDDLQPRYEQRYNELVLIFENKMKLLEEQVSILKEQNQQSQNLYQQKIKMLNDEILLLKRQNQQLRKRIKELEN